VMLTPQSFYASSNDLSSVISHHVYSFIGSCKVLGHSANLPYHVKLITEPRLVLSQKIVAKKEGCGPPEGSSIMPVPGST